MTNTSKAEHTGGPIDSIVTSGGESFLLRQAQGALQKSEAHFRALIEHSWDSVLLCSAEGVIQHATAGTRRMMGYETYELIGHDWLEFVHTEDHDALRRLLAELLEKPGISIHAAARVRHKNGSWHHLEGVLTNLLDDPNVGAIVNNFRDVTERTEARQQLERLFDLSLDMICVAGFDGYFKQHNPAFERTLGYTHQELREQPFLSFVHHDDRAKTIAAAKRLAAGGDVLLFENRYRCKDDTCRWFQWSCKPVPSEELIFAVVRDITQQKQTQQTLDSLRRQHELILNSVGEGIHGVDSEGRIMFENPAAAKLLGWEVNELIGRPAHETMHHSYADGSSYPGGRCPVYATRNDGVERRVSHEVFWRKDGSSFPVEYASTPMRDESGEIRGAVVTFRDISGSLTAEREARSTKERLQHLVSSSPAVLYALKVQPTEPRFLTTWVSGNIEKMLGFTVAEVIQDRAWWCKHLHPEDRDRALNECLAAERDHSRDSLVREYRFQRKEGGYLWLRDEIHILRDAQGEAVEFVGSWLDLTERKLIEEVLREQAELLNLAHDAIMVRDLDGRIQFWSRGCESIYGWSSSEAVGQLAAEFLYTDRERHDVAKRAVIETGEWNGELRQVRKGGTALILDSRWTLVRDEFGKPKSMLVINSDITEHKKLESQFLRAQRLESIGTLASGVAHDLNNILAPILMSAPLLRNHLPAATRDTILSTIETCAQRGADIVKQVLTFARGVDGERMLVQPVHVLKDVAKMAEETFPKSINIRACYPSNVWVVVADPTQLHQVMLNLCVNARDAMRDGGELVISAENLMVDESYAAMMPGAKPGPHVVIQVSDTGTGIPGGVIDQIFDPFFTTKDIGKGTGLGLSTVIGIVKSHGGFINVYSEVGRGATFKVFLPAAPEVQASVASEQDEPPPCGSGELVLIVDDEKGIRDLAQTILQRHGYKVTVAADGTEALAIFAQQMGEIKAVITDIMMPFMDGITLIRTLQKMKPGIAIIASTGRSDDKRASELAALGVPLCLMKPYSKKKLLTTMRDALNLTTK